MYTSDNQYMTDAGISGKEILVVLKGLDEGLYNMFKEYDYSEEEKERYRLGEELIKAVKEDNNIIQVNRLLEIGADVNIKDNDGMTVLMWASIYGYINIVDKLLEVEGIGVDIQDDDGDTALIYASSNGKKDIVERLLDMGADIDIQAKNGMTALMLASENGYIKIVKLLKARANVDIQDKYGKTALMYASEYGNKDIVELLQSHVREKE